MNLQLELGERSSTRGEHPSRLRWDRYTLKLLSVQEHEQLTSHLSDCAHCRAELATLEAQRSSFEAQRDTAAFLARIADDAARRKGPSAWFARWKEQFRPLVWAPIATLMVLLGLGVGYRTLLQEGGPHTSTGRHGTTGPQSPQNKRPLGVKGQPSLAVYLFRGQLRQKAKSGGVYKAGDTLGLAYHASGFRYLRIVLVDAKGQLSWLYPQSASHMSLPIAAHGRLVGGVELDDSKGAERLLAVFSMKPLRAKHIHTLQHTTRTGRHKLHNTEIFVRVFHIHKR